MIKFNNRYTIENGDSLTFVQEANGKVNGTYKNGTIAGSLEGNVLKATFHNTKANASGLMEITFRERGFDAKWKAGLDPGPMRGKWVGALEDEGLVNEINNDNASAKNGNQETTIELENNLSEKRILNLDDEKMKLLTADLIHKIGKEKTKAKYLEEYTHLLKLNYEHSLKQPNIVKILDLHLNVCISYKNYIDIINGVRLNGSGTKAFQNGDFYEGDFIEGKESGWGKLTKSNGEIIEGKWKNGVLTFSSGDLVSLKSGDLNMTVQSVDGNNVKCVYVYRGKPTSEYYDVSILKHIKN